jgi:predicted RecA/RadA family phage recombinase
MRYTPSGSAVSSGDAVVVGGLLGVAATDIAVGAEGVLSIEGVHRLPAVTGAEFVAGQGIVWDASVGLADDASATPATGDLTVGCRAMETVTAAAGASVAVKINVGPNTVA